MSRNLVETVLGAVVLMVAGVFLTFAYSSSQVGSVSGYQVVAKFDRVDGLTPGADVRVSGVKVGTVVEQTLDPETYLAVVRMSVRDSLKLPLDSSAEITSESLLGGKYVALVPGGEREMIAPGGEIVYTQSAISFENLLGQLVYGMQSGSGEKGQGEKP